MSLTFIFAFFTLFCISLVMGQGTIRDSIASGIDAAGAFIPPQAPSAPSPSPPAPAPTSGTFGVNPALSTTSAPAPSEPPSQAPAAPTTTIKTVNAIDELQKGSPVLPDAKPTKTDPYADDMKHEDSTVTPAEITTRKMYSGCGKQKGCVGEPKLCLEHKSCHSILTYNQEEQKVKFQVMGRAGKYAAIALSRDDKMGDDSVVECVREHGNEIKAYVSWNLVHDNKREEDQSAISDVKGSWEDGFIMCEFWRKVSTFYHNATFDLSKEEFIILHARGNEAKDGPKGNIGYHGGGSGFSNEKHDLGRQFSKSRLQKILEKAHSILLILAWLFFFPVATFIARYYKETFQNKVYGEYTCWFAWHKHVGLAGTGAVIAAIVAMVVSTRSIIGMGINGWNVHNVSGVALLAILMVVVGTGYVITAVNETRKCQVANWIHGLFGHGSFFVAYANYYWTMKMEAGLPCSAGNTLIAWIAIYFAIHLIMSYLVCYVDFVLGEGVSRAYNIIHLRVIPHHEGEDVTGSTMRKAFLRIFLLFSSIICSILVFSYLLGSPCTESE